MKKLINILALVSFILLCVGCQTVRPEKAEIKDVYLITNDLRTNYRTLIEWESDKTRTICVGKLGSVNEKIYIYR